MKKSLVILGSLLVTLSVVVVLSSCKKSKDNTNTLSNYFNVENGTFRSGTLPAGSVAKFDNVNINKSAMRGGTSTVKIQNNQRIQEIYVGVKGESGYYSVPASNSNTKSTLHNYEFVISFSQNLSGNFDIEVGAKLDDGSYIGVYSTALEFVNVGTGALQISLSFDQLKDVDLYVVTPDENVIYYQNRGFYIWQTEYDPDDEEINPDDLIWGLDLDSNAGCDIDSINNENVFFPSEYVQNGKYEVWVNMYSNCFPREAATNCVISAWYNGNRISPTEGNNPAYVVYPTDEPSNEIGRNYENGATKVMEFTISGAPSRSVAQFKAVKSDAKAQAKAARAMKN